MIARRTERVGRDAGTSLIEMLVTMVVFGLLGVAVTMSVQSLTHQSLATKSRNAATEQAQTVMDRTSRLLRAATAEGTPAVTFTYAGDTHATFYSNLAEPNGPTLVDISTTGAATDASLTVSTTPADAGSNYTYTGPSTTNKTAADLNTVGTPLFTYYDASGNVLSTPMTSVAQTSQIARVKVNLVDQVPGANSRAVSDSTLIYLRNVEYS